MKRIKKSDWILTAIYWAFVGVLIYPTFDNDSVILNISGVLLYAFFDTLAVFIFVFYIFPRYFPSGKFFRLISSLLLLMTIQFIIRDFTFYSLLGFKVNIFSGKGDLMGFVMGIIASAQSTGIFMTILISKQFYETQNKVLTLEKEGKENELRWLKSQVDPHFLFNNLNILDILIHKDPEKASLFTKNLSSLYRYFVRQKNQDIVALAEEWDFSKSYIFLLKQRFDQLFIFKDELSKKSLRNYFIPPASMQLLLENVVKHNVATDDQPIEVLIKLKDDFLIIENTYRPKKTKAIGTNMGLKNLQARIKLLTDNSIEINRTENLFIVKIPLVKQVN